VELRTAAVALGDGAAEAMRLDERLRAGDPPVVGRVVDDRLLLDCRTVLSHQVATLARALSAAAEP